MRPGDVAAVRRMHVRRGCVGHALRRARGGASARRVRRAHACSQSAVHGHVPRQVAVLSLPRGVLCNGSSEKERPVPRSTPAERAWTGRRRCGASQVRPRHDRPTRLRASPRRGHPESPGREGPRKDCDMDDAGEPLWKGKGSCHSWRGTYLGGEERESRHLEDVFQPNRFVDSVKPQIMCQAMIQGVIPSRPADGRALCSGVSILELRLRKRSCRATPVAWPGVLLAGRFSAGLAEGGAAIPLLQEPGRHRCGVWTKSGWGIARG